MLLFPSRSGQLPSRPGQQRHRWIDRLPPGPGPGPWGKAVCCCRDEIDERAAAAPTNLCVCVCAVAADRPTRGQQCSAVNAVAVCLFITRIIIVVVLLFFLGDRSTTGACCRSGIELFYELGLPPVISIRPVQRPSVEYVRCYLWLGLPHFVTQFFYQVCLRLV